MIFHFGNSVGKFPVNPSNVKTFNIKHYRKDNSIFFKDMKI